MFSTLKIQVQPTRVPKIACPPVHQLRNSSFKPYVTKHVTEHTSIEETMNTWYDPKWDVIQYNLEKESGIDRFLNLSLVLQIKTAAHYR